MSFFPNGLGNATSFTANGVVASNLYINGVLVWTSGPPPQTVTPTGIVTDEKRTNIDIQYTNNDDVAVDLYADEGQPIPTTFEVTIQPGQTEEVVFTGLSTKIEYTFYAYAIASGKSASEIISNTHTTD